MSFYFLLACSNAVKVGDSATEKNLSNQTSQSCEHADWNLPAAVQAGLIDARMTQCLMPFDILIAADENMPSAYVEMVAVIVSEMVDADKDGVADDHAVLEFLKQGQSAWLAMPMEREAWEQEQRPKLEGVLGYDLIIPMWWMEQGASSDSPSTHAKAVMVEEVTHFFTQFGWNTVYPSQLGVNSWDSIIAQETQRAACDWWQHPENSCPDNPAEYSGDCSDPSCDVVEFYHQVLMLRAGMQPAWFGIGFPQTKAALEEKLSDEMKAMMDDPQYYQRSTPITFSYPD